MVRLVTEWKTKRPGDLKHRPPTRASTVWMFSKILSKSDQISSSQTWRMSLLLIPSYSVFGTFILARTSSHLRDKFRQSSQDLYSTPGGPGKPWVHPAAWVKSILSFHGQLRRSCVMRDGSGLEETCLTHSRQAWSSPVLMGFRSMDFDHPLDQGLLHSWVGSGMLLFHT